MATSTSGCETSGDPIRSFDRHTWQCALPERISGPYDGSQLTSSAFPHAHFDEELPQQQHTLSAEAGNLDLDVFETMRVFHVASIVALGLSGVISSTSATEFVAVVLVPSLDSPAGGRETHSEENRDHLVENPAPRLHRIFAPDRRARRQDFDKREARAVALDLERFADRPPRFHDVLVV
jgi:hypothetical protein